MDISTLLPIATAFGLALLHSLWIGAVLYVGVRALLPLLPGPNARHHLAYGALLGLAAAFCYTLYLVYDPNPICESIATAGTLGNTPDLPDGATAANPAAWAEWFGTQLPNWAPWLSGAYLVGLFPALFFLLRDQGRVWSLRSQGLSELPYHWGNQLEEVLAEHPLTQRVKCYLSDQVGEVMTLGFWSPIIVFPVALVNELTPAMARTILLHEVAHLRHYDHWLNYPQQFIRTFFFFHPAAHALCSLIDREREHRCDDWVTARCSDRRTYATALVTVARTSHIPPNNLVMSATKTPFSQRIQRLFQGDNSRADRNFAFSMLLIVLLSMAHLGYTNWGADAGAADCWEEQATTAHLAALEMPFFLLRANSDAYTSAYRLSKQNPTTHHKWVVTEPTQESAPCPTRLTVEQLPYIAAPEVPESSSPQALEAYERARLKYEEIQQKTQHSARHHYQRSFDGAVDPLYLGISEQAAQKMTNKPCTTSGQLRATVSTNNKKQVAQSLSRSSQKDSSPRLIAKISQRPNKTTSTLITISKNHQFDCATKVTTEKQEAVSHNGLHMDESASIAADRVETIATLDHTEVISQLENVNFQRLMLISTPDPKAEATSLSADAAADELPGLRYTEASSYALTLPTAQVDEIVIEEVDAEPQEVIFFIDGAQVDAAAFSALRSEDIESISVVKDEKELLEKGCAAKDGLISVITKGSVF